MLTIYMQFVTSIVTFSFWYPFHSVPQISDSVYLLYSSNFTLHVRFLNKVAVSKTDPFFEAMNSWVSITYELLGLVIERSSNIVSLFE
jgi:hypothetical protein